MSTLIDPPVMDPSRCIIEQRLGLTQIKRENQDLFSNTHPLWHPRGSRGIFGGAIIAQCLAAAQRTVAADFGVHSMHCYFILAGDPNIPVFYHVEHVREGRSFATRTVQARQRGKAIFTTTLSFVRADSAGMKKFQDSVVMPDVPGPIEDEQSLCLGPDDDQAFENQWIDFGNGDSSHPHAKKCRQWVRARGTISPSAGHEAHLSALAYLSDRYLIGTLARVHGMKTPKPRQGRGPSMADQFLRIILAQDGDEDGRIPGVAHDTPAAAEPDKPEVSMFASLDHTIYFHQSRDFRVDDWLFIEMESPWMGDGRGLVVSKIWTRDGKLIATCMQEGVFRLKQPVRSKL